MKLDFKKIAKFIALRSIYFFLGACLAVSISYVYAAWNTKVSAGTQLTPDLWNDIVDKLSELDNKMANVEGGSTIKNYIENNCYVCLYWGDAGNHWDDSCCCKFGDAKECLVNDLSGDVDYNDDFGIRGYCD